MRYLVNSDYMKQMDEATILTHKISQEVLMERAALEVVSSIRSLFPDIRSIVVCCGIGNNGGDGLAVARLLNLLGIHTTVWIPEHTIEKESLGFQTQHRIFRSYGFREIVLYDGALPEHEKADLYVDALFGVGLTRTISGNYAKMIEKLNQIDAKKLAVDICSGVDATTGQVLGCAFQADVTVALGYGKIGQFLWPGAEVSGEVYVRDIGIYPEQLSFPQEQLRKQGVIQALEYPDFLQWLPVRREHSNKGTYGKVLIFAGMEGMYGAGYLAGLAAFYTGVGMVKIFCGEGNAELLRQNLPEAMVHSVDEVLKDTDVLQRELQWADSILVGPGIGQTKDSEDLLCKLFLYNSSPMVLDADGLNIISHRKELLREATFPIVLTPHLGEMGRLTGYPVSYIQTHLIEVACEFARAYGVQCVLKDFRTIVALPDGITYINLCGNNGMATAGSGDVLAGVIGGFLAQKKDFENAGVCAVFLHGTAGDRARMKYGTRSMTSRDIAGEIREFLKEIEINHE